jgi:hypothetical protein
MPIIAAPIKVVMAEGRIFSKDVVGSRENWQWGMVSWFNDILLK